MPTAPTPITPLPTAPSRADPANFPARADAFLTALGTFGSQLNATATVAYNNAVEADQDATAAAASQGAAAASQASAASSAASASTNAATATTKAAEAAASAAAANTSAGNAAGSAASALAIYGSTAAQQAAVTSAQNFASQAAASAASASSVVQQDLSGINAAALHRSPNAVTALFIYDTSKDSDGGAWTERCQHTSWYNEDINGAWRGAIGGASLAAAETTARAISGAATGDYFQYSGDGKFYRLNASSGTTEVFRGNKRDFPRLAALVGQGTTLTIYDITEPGRPMWMRLTTFNNSVQAVSAMNGVVAAGIGPGADNNNGLRVLHFVWDRSGNYGSTLVSNGGWTRSPGVRATGSQGQYDSSFPTIVGYSIAGVAMTVLPNAPINAATGLPVPTIAVAGASGVSVIRHDGTVVTPVSGSGSHESVRFSPDNRLWAGGSNGSNWGVRLIRSDFSAEEFYFSNATYNANPPVMSGGAGSVQLRGVSKTFVFATSESSLLNILFVNKARKLGSSNLQITNTFNTGHQIGDIRRTFLSDVGAGSATGTVADRSYKAASATITGTLTKTEVASAAQLVAYSGWSAANYAREAYSADLDFGTGDWSIGAWANIPVSMANASFPSTGSDLASGTWANGGSFPFDTFTASGSGFSGTKSAFGFSQAALPTAISVTAGKIYRVTAVVAQATDDEITIGMQDNSGGGGLGLTTSATFSTVTSSTTVIRYLRATSTGTAYLQFTNYGTAVTLNVTSVTLFEVNPSALVSRSHSSGASVFLGVSASGFLTATAFDGTTTRTVTTTTAYNTATWLKAEAYYRAGRLSLNVNGIEVASTAGVPLLTLNNSNAVLTIGNNNALDAPFPGSIALLKLSATVPSPDQALWMYEQEKQLFRAGAQCCLPDSGNIVDLSYDEATDRWVAVSAANESYWSGLVRASSAAVPAGSFTKIAARAGIELAARSTTTPGVDVTIPAYGLREELVNRAEAAARLSRDTVIFDYVGGFTANTTNGSAVLASVANLSVPASTTAVGAQVTGSGIPASTTLVTTTHLSAAATATATGVQINFTDFILPVGYEARAVLVAGAIKQEGATKDFTRLFDGFRETIRFGTAPGNTAWVQIQAVRVPQ